DFLVEMFQLKGKEETGNRVHFHRAIEGPPVKVGVVFCQSEIKEAPLRADTGSVGELVKSQLQCVYGRPFNMEIRIHDEYRRRCGYLQPQVPGAGNTDVLFHDGVTSDARVVFEMFGNFRPIKNDDHITVNIFQVVQERSDIEFAGRRHVEDRDDKTAPGSTDPGTGRDILINGGNA